MLKKEEAKKEEGRGKKNKQLIEEIQAAEKTKEDIAESKGKKKMKENDHVLLRMIDAEGKWEKDRKLW